MNEPPVIYFAMYVRNSDHECQQCNPIVIVNWSKYFCFLLYLHLDEVFIIRIGMKYHFCKSSLKYKVNKYYLTKISYTEVSSTLLYKNIYVTFKNFNWAFNFRLYTTTWGQMGHRNFFCIHSKIINIAKQKIWLIRISSLLCVLMSQIVIKIK